jgi:hypothetical protein
MSNERDLLDLEVVREALFQGEIWAWNSPLMVFILLEQDFDWEHVARDAFIKILQYESELEPVSKDGLVLLKSTISTWWYSRTDEDLMLEFLYLFSTSYQPFQHDPVFKQTLRTLVELIPNLTKEEKDFLNDPKKRLPPDQAESNAGAAIRCYHQGDILFLGMRITRAILDAKGVAMDGSNPNLGEEFSRVQEQLGRILQESIPISFWMDKALDWKYNIS